MESNIRLLADLAFMVQDYELALGYYRMVRDDFKSDKVRRKNYLVLIFKIFKNI